MDKFIRKLTRFSLHSGDIVSITLLVFAIFLDLNGYLPALFPYLQKEYITYGIFAVFVLFHIFQRLTFEANKPILEIKEYGWETIKTRDYERLFVNVVNRPILNSPKNDATKTGARIYFVRKDTKTIDHKFEDVRWQGTPAAQADGYNYQPYDNWVVDIESGRSRLLYIALRRIRKDNNAAVYVHRDKTYQGDSWQVKELKLTGREYHVCVVLWSNNSDPVPHWFDFTDEKLTPIKPRKEIANIVEI